MFDPSSSHSQEPLCLFSTPEKPSKLFWSTGALSCSFSESEFNRCYELGQQWKPPLRSIAENVLPLRFSVIRVGIATLGPSGLKQNVRVSVRRLTSHSLEVFEQSFHPSLLALLPSSPLNVSSNGIHVHSGNVYQKCKRQQRKPSRTNRHVTACSSRSEHNSDNQ
jgi:hypothetical protein